MQAKQHWEKIYAGKSPSEVSWYQKQPKISLRLIKNTGVGKTASIIDVGGGASTLVDHLCSEGYKNIAVLDVSTHALDYARQRLGEKAADVEWIDADITDYRSTHRFDIWHDRAVFHFLTEPSGREQYVEIMKHTLKPGGHAIIATFAIGGPTQCSGLDIVQYDAGKLQAELGDAFQLIETQGETHTTPANVDQAFMYYRFSYC